MKIDRTVLVNALKAVKACTTDLASNATSHVTLAFTADGYGVMSATNFDLYRSRELTVESAVAGCVILPLAETLKGLSAVKGNDVVIECERVITEITESRPVLNAGGASGMVDVKGEVVHYRSNLTCGKFSLELDNLPDYSELPESPAKLGDVAVSMHFDPSVLAAAVKRLTYCMSRDVTRPSLCGAFLEIDDGVTLTATDGHRLATGAVPTVRHAGKTSVVLPAAGVEEIARMAQKSAGEVRFVLRAIPQPKAKRPKYVERGDGTFKAVGEEEYTPDPEIVAVVQIGDDKLAFRCPDETYPDYRKVAPTTMDVRVVAKVRAMAETLKTVTPWAPKTNTVFFTPREEDCMIAANGDRKVSDAFDAEVDGPPIKVGLNHKYVSDVLAVIRGESITVRLHDQYTPAVIDDGDARHIVMPMRI
jgi:DNA polymerase-3 subunit beta